MAKCHENRKARERRKRRADRRRERRERQDFEDSFGWLCDCGNWIEDGLHCEICGMEPPWGCPCAWCDDRHSDDFDDRHSDDFDDCPDDPYEDYYP